MSKYIYFTIFAHRSLHRSVHMEGELTSVKISEDSRYALINHAPDVTTLFLVSNISLTIHQRKFICGTWRSLDLHASSLGNDRATMSFAVVLVASMATSSLVGVKV